MHASLCAILYGGWRNGKKVAESIAAATCIAGCCHPLPHCGVVIFFFISSPSAAAASGNGFGLPPTGVSNGIGRLRLMAGGVGAREQGPFSQPSTQLMLVLRSSDAGARLRSLVVGEISASATDSSSLLSLPSMITPTQVWWRMGREFAKVLSLFYIVSRIKSLVAPVLAHEVSIKMRGWEREARGLGLNESKRFQRARDYCWYPNKDCGQRYGRFKMAIPVPRYGRHAALSLANNKSI